MSLESSFLCVPRCVVLFVAVSPIPMAGVRPFIVLSYRYRISNDRNYYRNTELFRFDTYYFLSNDISKVSVRYPTLWVSVNQFNRFLRRRLGIINTVTQHEKWQGTRKTIDLAGNIGQHNNAIEKYNGEYQR